ALALSVHAARRLGLGFDPAAGAGRSDDWRAASQGRDVREPQRILLSARSRDRKTDQGKTVHRHELGKGDTSRRPAGTPSGQPPERGRHPSVSGPEWRDELDAAVVRSGPWPAVRDRARIVRQIL